MAFRLKRKIPTPSTQTTRRMILMGCLRTEKRTRTVSVLLVFIVRKEYLSRLLIAILRNGTPCSSLARATLVLPPAD